MAKSMVERYEQLLLQDPTSAVFVELAKLLLEQGDEARAIEVCERGISHHSNSVIGRVVWGKALLQLGRPAQAMEQFDQAIAIDKENAHAYNLISEVLVQRGLFRSALPILRKAVALQPNDTRVKLWLEQTQQALGGGPPPVMANLPGLTANALAPQPSSEESVPVEQPPPSEEPPASEEPAQAAEPRGAMAASEDPFEDEEPEITSVFTLRTLKLDPPPAPEPEALEVTPPVPRALEVPEPEQSPQQATGPKRVEVVMFPPRRRPPPPPADDEDTHPGGDPSEDGEAPPAFEPEHHMASGGLLPDVEEPTAPEEFPAQQEASPEWEPPTQAPEAAPPTASGGGLLGDLPPPEEPDDLAAIPAAARISEDARTSAPRRSRAAARASSKRSLLEDIPEAAEPPGPSAPARRASASEVDTEAIAAAYEKELREKLIRKSASASFASRYGMKLGVGAVVLVVLAVGLGAYFQRRAVQGGKTLMEVLDRTERVIAQDTRASLREALTLLARAREMDDGSSRVWALTAYTHALLYVDHGASTEDRQQALSALERPGVRTGHAGLALATDVLVADEKARAVTRRALLESTVADSTELHAVAGSLLLEEKKQKEAVERFKQALALSSRNVRALVELGRYYQDFDDPTNALRMYASAREVSPEHPWVRVGMAESRLALGQELEEALGDMEVLGGYADLPELLRARQHLAQGRLLSELGRDDEALSLLSRRKEGPLAFDFQLALGEASRAAGRLEEAQQAYEAALKLQPRSEAAREGLGRTLLDRDRVKEALERMSGDNSRRAALVRAAAHARMEDWKSVRVELNKTRVNNLYPPEAVGYLAIADTADGNGEQAREVLEKAVSAAKRPRNDLRLALGRVYWRLNVQDKAQAQFEEAMKDPRDYEAACALGRLFLSRGLPDMALKPLTQAVQRNGFHGEARDALGRALLSQGRTEEAFKHFEAWKNHHPDSAQAQKGFALALFHAGKRQEAAEAVGRAVKLAPSDSEGHRLRAVILFGAGESRAAFSALERANRLDPRDSETFCEIAHAFLRQDKREEAAAAFEAARREGPDTLCGLVGQYYANPADGGRTAGKALESFAAKASTVWDKSFAHTARARVLLEAGAVKDARAAAEEAVKLSPFSGQAHLALGLVVLKQRQEAPALASLTRAVELEPAHGPARLALADALVRKSDQLSQAVQEYEAFLKLASGSPEARRVRKALPSLKRRAR